MFLSILNNFQISISQFYLFIEAYHLPIFLLILLLMVFSFILELLPMEVTALATLGLLWFFNILTIEESISGLEIKPW